ncbi:MAG: DEAD/DEAH box helicase, partial [Dehalococcoidia bacterium]
MRQEPGAPSNGAAPSTTPTPSRGPRPVGSNTTQPRHTQRQPAEPSRRPAPRLPQPPAAPAQPLTYDDTPAADGSAFASLGVAADIAKALRAGGIEEPFAIQTEAIPVALAGRDLCGKARTGSGKTLAFGIPLVQRTTRARPGHPKALVLVPTRELASQVARAIHPLALARRLRLDVVYGGVSLFRQAQSIRSGLEIVIATPGRLNDLLERGDVSMADVQLVVLDEADQMADMGFLPQVERILRHVTAEHQTLLFSATLDGDVDQLVKRFQQDPVYVEVESDPDDDATMSHRFIGVSEAEKVAVAVAICGGPERSLLFVRTQRAADRLALQLDREGLRAGVLHGGLSQQKRERSLAAFSSGHVNVLVATNLAARGIHVDGIDMVIHYDLPDEFKAYVHRSGRTARAGASGMVVTLVTPLELRDAAELRRRAGLTEATVAMSPDDPRLRDLANWIPPVEPVAAVRSTPYAANPDAPRNYGERQREWRPAGGR